MSEILIPADAWEGDQEAVVVNWLYRNGAQVTQGEVLCEIMYEKVQVDILAPSSGTLNLGKAVDDLVLRGDSLGRVD